MHIKQGRRRRAHRTHAPITLLVPCTPTGVSWLPLLLLSLLLPVYLKDCPYTLKTVDRCVLTSVFTTVFTTVFIYLLIKHALRQRISGPVRRQGCFDYFFFIVIFQKHATTTLLVPCTPTSVFFLHFSCSFSSFFTERLYHMRGRIHVSYEEEDTCVI